MSNNKQESFEANDIAEAVGREAAEMINQVFDRMTRGIVRRLSYGAEVQKLCSTSIECFDLKFSELFSSCAEKKEAPRSSRQFGQIKTTVWTADGYVAFVDDAGCHIMNAICNSSVNSQAGL
ncbi:hypothetical protein TSUD_369450 [Trifolium subterraneum]|uniref:Uncharacterized protein n=1 Tax=Trifolium subterraneum TaxID=3900 RepID=A0A2Z6PFV9_TRISU|nr:hypothetical protein TSUD_369450 [Trifolium subterraneum]